MLEGKCFHLFLSQFPSLGNFSLNFFFLVQQMIFRMFTLRMLLSVRMFIRMLCFSSLSQEIPEFCYYLRHVWLISIHTKQIDSCRMWCLFFAEFLYIFWAITDWIGICFLVWEFFLSLFTIFTFKKSQWAKIYFLKVIFGRLFIEAIT